MRIAFLLILITCSLLTGCDYESEYNLHSGMQEYKPTQFFKSGKHVFKNSATNEYIALNVFNSMVAVRKVKMSTKTKPNAHYFYKLYHDGSMKVGDYLAFKTSGTGINRKYSYFAFTFLGEERGFTWIQAKSGTKVTSRKQLVSLINENKTSNGKQYNKVGASEAQRVLAHIEFLNKKSANETTNSSNTNTSVPSGISAYDVGDAVYLVDEPGIGTVSIIRVDRTKNLIKIRRPDKTVAWLKPNQVSINPVNGVRYVVCLHNKTSAPIKLTYRWADSSEWKSLTIQKTYRHWFSHPKDIKMYVKYDKDLSSTQTMQEYYLLRKKSTVGQDKIDCEQGTHYDFTTKGNTLNLIKAS
ncbi:hypothetical protein [Gayadomonas joobiniege]|uniref:hypothetical protein n=1 Tax=Gayadomonas joobiniege TaxID=1234606 RepID=UPI00035FCE67|nr:hypothetical protein [Gayadomonas joobiniege]